MKVYLNGATHFGGQVPRIAEGFRALGHEVTEHVSEADLVYSNNDHAQLVADQQAGRLKPGAKLILTCLDIPEHLFSQGYDVRPLAEQLQAADAVCTISQFGRQQVQRYCDLDSTVIYQPIKPITRSPEKRYEPFPRFLSVGRRGDPNKRHALAAHALQLLGYDRDEVALVGNEPGWGDYIGVLRDEDLNIAYNSVDFVLCTSRLEGLCLPVVEAMAAGAVPVVCNDLSTLQELLPKVAFPEFNAVEPNPPSIARFIASLLTDDGQRLAELKDRLHVHYLAQWAERTSPTGVARAILQAYEALT